MFNEEPQNYSCPFCRIINSGLHNEKDYVYESENVFVIMALDQHEGSGSTLLVIPKFHVENIYDITEELLSEISVVSKFIATKMRELWDISGISIWQHNESSGYQDVWHFHTHIKGRIENDNLYKSGQVEVPVETRYSLAQELKKYIAST